MTHNTTQHSKGLPVVPRPWFAWLTVSVFTAIFAFLGVITYGVFTDRTSPVQETTAQQTNDPIRVGARFADQHPLYPLARVCDNNGGVYFGNNTVGHCSWSGVAVLVRDIELDAVSACHAMNGLTEITVYKDTDHMTDEPDEIVMTCTLPTDHTDGEG